MQWQFDSLQAFLHMNGHGFYVWLAYGVSILVLSSVVLYPVIRKKQFLKEQLRVQQLNQALQSEQKVDQQVEIQPERSA